jgi:prophage tail gpP-like protein
MTLGHKLRIVFLDDDSGEANAAYSGWTEYDFQQNIQEVPYTGTLTLVAVAPGDPTWRDLVSKMRRNPKLALLVDGVKRATCRVRDLEQSCGVRRPQTLVASVEDLLGQPYRNPVPLDLSLEGLTVKQVGEKLFGPFGLRVIVDDRANRAAITTRAGTADVSWAEMTPAQREAAVAVEPELARLLTEQQEEHQASQAIQDLLMRDGEVRTFAVSRLSETRESRALHPSPDQLIGDWWPEFLREHGLLCWGDADGNVILSTPDYTAAPQFMLELRLSGGQTWEGTILDSKLVEQPGAQTTEVRVYGHTGKIGDDDAYASAKDTELEGRGYKQLLVLPEASLRDGTAAKRKAETTLHEAQMAAWVYEATIAGHAAGMLMPAPNMLAAVHDESVWLDDNYLDERLHIVGLGFGYRPSGPTCTVRCIRPGLWST